jgi:hypothetical protein
MIAGCDKKGIKLIKGSPKTRWSYRKKEGDQKMTGLQKLKKDWSVEKKMGLQKKRGWRERNQKKIWCRKK